MKGLSTLTAIALCAAASAQTYHVVGFGILGEEATGINDAGQVCGFLGVEGTSNAAYLYDSATNTFTDLGSLYGFGAAAFGINASGDVVGACFPTEDGSTMDAFLYTNGQMTDIGLAISPRFSRARAINSSGFVVGQAGFPSGGHAFVYSGWGILDLGTLPGGASSEAFAINSSLQIVGDGGGEAFISSGSTMQPLGNFPGGHGSIAYGINDNGLVVGQGYRSDGYRDAFIYSGGPLIDLGRAPGDDASWAYAINNSGLIVGTSESYVRFIPANGCTWTNGLFQDLTSLLDSSGAGITIITATSVNSSGQIAGMAAETSGADPETYGVILTPNPVDVPTSYSIFRGVYASGSLSSLGAIDSNYLKVLSGPTLTTTEPQISVIVNGTSSFANPSDLRFALTAHSNTANLTQTIELWDFTASAWVKVGTQASVTHDTIQVAQATNPSRFVQPSTNAVRARVSWKQTGPTLLYQWAVFIDQTAWWVAE